MKQYLSFSVIAGLILTIFLFGIALVADNPPTRQEEQASSGPALQMSNTPTQAYTDVTGDNLQQGSAPDRSTTSSDLSPQQAATNYCLPGEVPYADGCVPR